MPELVPDLEAQILAALDRSPRTLGQLADECNTRYRELIPVLRRLQSQDSIDWDFQPIEPGSPQTAITYQRVRLTPFWHVKKAIER